MPKSKTQAPVPKNEALAEHQLRAVRHRIGAVADDLALVLRDADSHATRLTRVCPAEAPAARDLAVRVSPLLDRLRALLPAPDPETP